MFPRNCYSLVLKLPLGTPTKGQESGGGYDILVSLNFTGQQKPLVHNDTEGF